MEIIGTVCWAIAFAVCVFVVGCACMAVKEKATETEEKIEDCADDIEGEKVCEYLCPTLPKELNTPENNAIVNILASHAYPMTASEIGEKLSIPTQRVCVLIYRLCEHNYVVWCGANVRSKGTLKTYKINLEKFS